mgnify:CR=1 FL=1
MKVGDKVIWRSQAAGTPKVKEGTIVGVIPTYVNPQLVIHDFCSEYGASSAFGFGKERNHESYVVLVKNGKRKPKIYWPRVSKLSLVEPVS